MVQKIVWTSSDLVPRMLDLRGLTYSKQQHPELKNTSLWLTCRYSDKKQYIFMYKQTNVKITQYITIIFNSQSIKD
jgi:hypothetical protein